MVTLKREEQTENRYGGYSTRFSGRMETPDRFARFAEPDLFETNNSTYAETEYDNYLWDELKRTAPRRISTESEYASAHSAEQAYRNEYVAPVARPERRASTRRSGLSLKGKLLIVLYAAVVVLFASIIITNAITIDGYDAELSKLETELSEAEVALDSALAQSAVVDETEIKNQAIANGMVEATGSVGYEVIPIAPGPDYQINTNWFDRMCDGVSSVFGG